LLGIGNNKVALRSCLEYFQRVCRNNFENFGFVKNIQVSIEFTKSGKKKSEKKALKHDI